MASLNVGNLGEYLREQRRNAQLSLRQLADAAGVSNPYLSQIERGLRKPSAEMLQQVAKALRISAETLYVQAGILDERDRDEMETRAVILADPRSTSGRSRCCSRSTSRSARRTGRTPRLDGDPARGDAVEAEHDRTARPAPLELIREDQHHGHHRRPAQDPHRPDPALLRRRHGRPRPPAGQEGAHAGRAARAEAPARIDAVRNTDPKAVQDRVTPGKEAQDVQAKVSEVLGSWTPT